MTIGIFSRKAIPIKEAKEILGNPENVRVVEKETISNNLINYLTKKYGFLNPVQEDYNIRD